VPEDAIIASWHKLLPAKLAKRCAPLRVIEDSRLIIQCESAIIKSEARFFEKVCSKKSVNSLAVAKLKRFLGLRLRVFFFRLEGFLENFFKIVNILEIIDLVFRRATEKPSVNNVKNDVTYIDTLLDPQLLSRAKDNGP
jgi:hypothetical protein